MRSISQVSFVKRATAVLTASMILLSGVVLTAGPANAATTETVPYTYTVKVPVTKTVYEYQVIKSVVNKRTVYTYQRVAKEKIEYRTETRTGYRQAPVKVADKPAAAQFKVQVAPNASFKDVTKEIVVTPATSGTNKVNLSSQLPGNVGDVAYVRVVAKNAAGKSTPGKVAKLTFGEVSRSNYDVQVPYTATGTTMVAAGYTEYYTNYNDPIYRSDWVAPTYRDVYRPATWGSRYVSFTNYRTESYQVRDGTKKVYSHSEQYISGYETETYRDGSKSVAYNCGYWQYVWNPPRWISKTCYSTEPVYKTRQVPVYSWRAVYDYIPLYTTAYRDVAFTDYRWEDYLIEPGYWDTEVASAGYWQSTLVGYGQASRYVAPRYENYQYTAYTTETRTAINNGWKAATN